MSAFTLALTRLVAAPLSSPNRSVFSSDLTMVESKICQNSTFCSQLGPKNARPFSKGLRPSTSRSFCRASATTRLSLTEYSIKNFCCAQKASRCSREESNLQLGPTRDLAVTLCELLAHKKLRTTMVNTCCSNSGTWPPEWVLGAASRPLHALSDQNPLIRQ